MSLLNRSIYHILRTRFVPKQFSTSSEVTLTQLTPKEKQLEDILSKKFPLAKKIIVSDVSGGCGSMYDVTIESEEFRELTLVKQHQTVTNALREEIKLLHGIRIQTKLVP